VVVEWITLVASGAKESAALPCGRFVRAVRVGVYRFSCGGRDAPVEWTAMGRSVEPGFPLWGR
jgi:hypothetical protein